MAILVLQLAEIILRLAGGSLPFVSETTGFLMAALTFLALPEVTRRREHLTADFVVLMMSESLRRKIELLISPAVSAVYVAALIYTLWGLAYTSWLDGVRSEGITRTPLWIPQAVLLFGLAMMLLRLLVALVRAIRRWPVVESAP
nr:TRAP transporter small permease [Acuticoccus mangrovi]